MLTRKTPLALAATAILTGGLLVGSQPAQAAGPLPCDIYATGGTPCVAAHSTTRARLELARSQRVAGD